jgi:hypothetical protein
MKMSYDHNVAGWDQHVAAQESAADQACRAHAAPILGEDVDPEMYQVENDLDCEDMPCAEGCPLLKGGS